MILVDAHVHVYPAYDRAAFLDGAAANFARHGSESGGALLLAERSQEDAFNELARVEAVDAWKRVATGEPESLWFERRGTRILLVAGRQIVARSGIEVLSLLCKTSFADGQPVGDTIRDIENAGGLPLLPWGIGKWAGQRGRMVESILEESAGRRLFVGDNGGRLRGSAMPALLTRAIERGQWMLPGTDPLPIASEQSRAGSYGLVLDQPIERGDRPAAAAREALRGLTAQPRTYGELTSPLRFLRNQAHMQWRKRFNGGRKA